MVAHNNTIRMLDDKSDANTERHQRLIQWDDLAGQLAIQGRFQESAAAIERLFAGGGPQNKEAARLLDADYPSVEEIRQAAREYVDRECGGEWPEDAWFDVGTSWSVDVWEDRGRPRITVYRDFMGADGFRETDTSAGITIQ